jgi:hypothetical protein
MRMPDGAPAVIAHLSGVAQGGTWGDQGAILVSIGSHLYAAPAAGSDAKPVDVTGLPEGDVVQPEFLPGGTDFLFGSVSRGSDQVAIYLATLREGKSANSALLLRNDTAARYTPAFGGRILFVRSDNLYAQKLDLKLCSHYAWTAHLRVAFRSRCSRQVRR